MRTGITWDGYHPASTVAVTLIREHLSHFCELLWEGGSGGEDADAAGGLPAQRVARAKLGCSGAAGGGAYSALAAEYAVLVLLVGAYFVRRLVMKHCQRAGSAA